ncbi:MAG: tRNA guanosine(34) transglycosylase Tgt [Acidobacteria bacterium]|nr:MAG: tRNA guanosine(34) transglycosylase Tgt [Acidobacteriota bacterium]
MGLKFSVVAKDENSRARAGILHTPHGDVETPVFMPVGTAGAVKAMTQERLEEVGAQIILANTYHLCMRPGHEKVRELGGLHRFMSWPHPILTDSGGFQVMSLKGLGKVTEDGVWFRSHLDGTPYFFSPESVVEFQLSLGADIIMPLDECVDYPASHETLKRSVRLTDRWAERSKQFFAANVGKSRLPAFEDTGKAELGPSLFGIVQGGTDQSLRRESVLEIGEIGFDGYAIGGLSVGEPKDELYGVTAQVAGLLPEDQPRYLMGVGTPEDLVKCVALGIDMFDCVMPTRNARNGTVFTSEGKLVIKSARCAQDLGPLDAACGCLVCQRYSRAYIRHLFAVGEISAPVLATYHNLWFYLDTMKRVRQAIRFGGFGKFLAGVPVDSVQGPRSV